MIKYVSLTREQVEDYYQQWDDAKKKFDSVLHPIGSKVDGFLEELDIVVNKISWWRRIWYSDNISSLRWRMHEYKKSLVGSVNPFLFDDELSDCHSFIVSADELPSRLKWIENAEQNAYDIAAHIVVFMEKDREVLTKIRGKR